ncbi:uncharacterized protein LOC129228424 [Uloborus diversus]|uniref:uncharacterized protein LOC129228424 n=1 Tax=Uloborus diversus TaxID=327109 RepID=UPI002409D290|nr:uncharacterized protein LOC129228424 [Uloborus diversus]
MHLGAQLKKENKSQRNQKTARRVLLRIVKAYRTVSYEAIFVLAGAPPLDIVICNTMLARDAYLRSVRDVHLNSTLSPSDLPHPSKRVPISLVDFNATNLNNYDFVCFTDGSKINERVGLAFVLYQHEIEFSIHQFRISDNCSVFQAELLCLNLAVKHVSNFLGTKVLICSDSLSSLFSLLNVRSFEKLIVEVQSIISNINSHDICVDFTHVRGHSGIRGNERADALAKEATRLPFSLDVANPPSFWKLFYSKKATNDWNSEYLSSNKGK